MDIVHTKATFNTETIVIGWAITTFDADNLFIFNVIGNLATHSTEWANRIHFAINGLRTY